MNARTEQDVINKLFDIGCPDANHRVIQNSTIDGWEAAGRPISGHRPGESETVGIYAAGDITIDIPRYAVCPTNEGFDGDIDAAALYAGESVDRISAVQPAAEVVATVVAALQSAQS